MATGISNTGIKKNNLSTDSTKKKKNEDIINWSNGLHW